MKETKNQLFVVRTATSKKKNPPMLKKKMTDAHTQTHPHAQTDRLSFFSRSFEISGSLFPRPQSTMSQLTRLSCSLRNLLRIPVEPTAAATLRARTSPTQLRQSTFQHKRHGEVDEHPHVRTSTRKMSKRRLATGHATCALRSAWNHPYAPMDKSTDDRICCCTCRDARRCNSERILQRTRPSSSLRRASIASAGTARP